MCERSSAWQRGNCLLLQYRLPVLFVVECWKISIYRNDKIFTISVIYQPCPARPHMCNPEEYELHTVIFPFAQQYFEWWWCTSNVYLLLGFCQFRRACFQHDNSRVAKLRKFILYRQMNFNINFFACVHNTVFTWPVWITCTICVMKGRVQLFYFGTERDGLQRNASWAEPMVG